jgi:L-iditol 2-dehydrogenase
MRAAVLHGKELVRIEEVPIKPLGAGEVRIDIHAALTCGTDLKVYRRGYHAKMIVPPAVFGHELAGIIAEVGKDIAADWRVGERVVVANSAPCDDCVYCRAGQQNLCDHLQFLNGAYAESITVPARLVRKNLLRVATETSLVDAALVEPLACVVLGMEETHLKPGERVLVVGAGPIGLMFVVLARELGCEVTVVGRGEKRLETARRLGAHVTIGAGAGNDLVGTVRGSTDAHFDAVIEAVGKPEVWEAAAALVRKGGRVNFFGGCPTGTRVSFDTAWLHYSSVRLAASFHHNPASVRRALDYIQRRIVRSADFVDGECSLEQLPTLFQAMAAGNRAVKTLVRTRT